MATTASSEHSNFAQLERNSLVLLSSRGCDCGLPTRLLAPRPTTIPGGKLFQAAKTNGGDHGAWREVTTTTAMDEGNGVYADQKRLFAMSAKVRAVHGAMAALTPELMPKPDRVAVPSRSRACFS